MIASQHRVIATSALALAAFALVPAHAERFGYLANGYGTYADNGTKATSSPSALAGIGCRATPPASQSNTTESSHVPSQFTAGQTDTSVDASIVNGVPEAESVTKIGSISMLGGIVTGSNVKAVSETIHDGTGFHTRSAGTSFGTLAVRGVKVPTLPSPNTKMPLPGIGELILNEQIADNDAKSASLKVNMFHVTVTNPNNPLGLAEGSEIIAGHAASGLEGPAAGMLGGEAYGSSMSLSTSSDSGPSAPIFLDCEGTDGDVRANDGGDVDITGVLNLGAVEDTAQGTVDSTTATGETTSTVNSPNVANVVMAGSMHADAHAAIEGGKLKVGDDGTNFTNLTVPGHPEIKDNVPANTHVPLNGYGTLWLKREIMGPDGLEIRMMELILDKSNKLKLPAGTDIRLGVAHAAAYRVSLE
jgi:hypothetical protein